MDLLNSALQGASSAPASSRAATGAAESLVVLGAGGTLGSAVLERALSSGHFAPVRAVVREPLASALRGLEVCHASSAQTLQLPLQPPLTTTALMVFERQRRSNGRDDAFFQPASAELLPWARALARCGVRRLLVVVPHAPSMLPAALKQGFASHDEHALAALGFEHLLILRPAQAAAGKAGTAANAPRLQRFADWWLSQLNWMVPASEQAVRTPKLAELVVELARLAASAPAATRVVPPELLASSAAAADSTEALRRWLHTPPG